jgi:hypothetical protein
MLDDMLYPDRIAISKLRPWMNGTTVVLGSGKRVMAFRPDCGQCDTPRYKTVNLYSLSLKTWKAMEERLSDYVSDDRLGVYYEAVFTDMVADGSLAFDAVFFDADRWYEIDTLADLDEAEKLYASPISITQVPSPSRAAPLSLSSRCPALPEIDHTAVDKYWSGVKASILGPYMMDGFGFPASAGHFRFRAESRIVKRLLRNVDQNGAVLDLGCGVGYWAEVFARNGLPRIRTFVPYSAMSCRSNPMVTTALFFLVACSCTLMKNT